MLGFGVEGLGFKALNSRFRVGKVVGAWAEPSNPTCRDYVWL